MRKLSMIVLLAIGCAHLQAQQAVVDAEKAFAKYAVDASVKKAFLQYMDSTSVVFDHGQVLNGIQYWQKIPESKTVILWKPVFAAMAASGELGFTTGPYELRSSIHDTAFGAGQYSTVWRKNKNGEWKFLVDMGMRYYPSQLNTTTSSFYSDLIPAAAVDTSVWKLEQQFITAFNANGAAAYAAYLCDQSWFNIDSRPPYTNKEAIVQGLSKVPAGLTFTPLGTGMAQSRDLAYCYGQTVHEGKTENYLRVWVHMAGGWKILLQVLKWQ